ncbi:hypothetical protein INR99_01945 [Chitinilyticum litopenaei]|uniref:Uncharacterized protein n=2 Tax=Chitinilyticum piscinae TaxID=2866724 RepID=A0A8J7FJV2_9NEIS|nr:hypothetical protein [Chitinilyticum piscinae]
MITLLAALNTASPVAPASEREQLRLPNTAQWSRVDGSHVAIWTGRQEAWLLTFSKHCTLPQTGQVLVLHTSHGHLQRGLPVLPDNAKACKLERIAPAVLSDTPAPTGKVQRIDHGTDLASHPSR